MNSAANAQLFARIIWPIRLKMSSRASSVATCVRPGTLRSFTPNRVLDDVADDVDQFVGPLGRASGNDRGGGLRYDGYAALGHLLDDLVRDGSA